MEKISFGDLGFSLKLTVICVLASAGFILFYMMLLSLAFFGLMIE